MQSKLSGQGASVGSASLEERMTELAEKVAYLTDRCRIIDLYYRYTRGLNRYDVELLRSAFWPDAQVNYGFNSRTGDEWIAHWQQKHAEGVTSQAHYITNQSIDLDGCVAHVESYLIAFRRSQDEASTIVGGGRYIDRLDRRNGEWRVAVREFIPHFWIETSSVFDSYFSEDRWPRSGWGLGTQDRSDVSYQRPLNPRARNGTQDERRFQMWP